MRNIPKEMGQILDERIVSKMKYKFLTLFLAAALAALLYPPLASATPIPILKSAENFAVLAGTPMITNTGSTTITGDVGISPAASITGKGPGANEITLTGAYHEADATALTAKNDLSTAYTALNNMPASQTLTNDQLAGLTLTSGVYAFSGSPAAVLLDGTLYLNANHTNNAYWVFQIPYQLTTGVSSSVVVQNLGSNGGKDDGVFFVVGSLAALSASTSFEGNILAGVEITLGTSATILNGRALAETGEVTMDTNTISNVCPNGGLGYSGGLEYNSAGAIVPIGPSSTVPEPSTMLLLGSGLAGLAAFRKRFKKA
jgi:hypothetical protein